MLWYNGCMRKTRLIENCRCYHLISRLAHQAVFLDDDEKSRAVELLRRVEEFCGVMVLAYAIMSNHFHIFIYVPEPGEIDDGEILRRINALYREASLARVLGEWRRLKDEESDLLKRACPTKKFVSRFRKYRRTDPPPSKADPGLAMPRKHGVELERGRPEIVERILKLLESGPLRSSAIRKAVGICSGIHLSRYYLTPMMEKGLIKRTDPDHPQSPQQRYRMA